MHNELVALFIFKQNGSVASPLKGVVYVEYLSVAAVTEQAGGSG